MKKLIVMMCLMVLGLASGLRAAAPRVDMELTVEDVYGGSQPVIQLARADAQSAGADVLGRSGTSQPVQLAQADIELTVEDVYGGSSTARTRAAEPEAAADVELTLDDVYGDPVSTGGEDYDYEAAVSESDEQLAAMADDEAVDDGSYSLYDDYLVLDKTGNSLELGVEWFDYTYREEGFMKLDGTMAGVYAVYTHRQAEPQEQARHWKDLFKSSKYALFDMIRLDTRFSQGDDIKYRGSAISEDETHWTWESRAVIGYDVALQETVTVTPYIGLGYRYLMDDNGGETIYYGHTGYWTYDRESKYIYMPIGFDIVRKLADRWTIGLNLEYDIFLDGEQTSHFEDGPAGSNYDTAVNEQDEGYGLRGSLRLVREGTRMDFVIEPFARYWHIKDSEITFLTSGGQHIEVSPGYYLVGIEPNNRTWEFGIRAGIRF